MDKKALVILFLLVIPISFALPDHGHDITSIGGGNSPIGNYNFTGNVTAQNFYGYIDWAYILNPQSSTSTLPYSNITGTPAAVTTLPYSNITGTPNIPSTYPLANITGTSTLINTSGGIINGDLTINGIFRVIGSYINLTVTNAYVNGSSLPTYDNLFDLGSSTLRWANLYAATLYGSLNASYIQNAPWLTTYTDTNDTIRVDALENSNSTQQALIAALQTDNTTQSGLINARALPGTCTNGNVVMNTTTSGVQCVALPASIVDTDTWNTTQQMILAVNGTFLNLANSFGYTETDSVFVANRTSIWTLLQALVVDNATQAGLINAISFTDTNDTVIVDTLVISNASQQTLIAGLQTDNITQAGLINNKVSIGSANQTLSYCGNITGAASNLCTITQTTDTDTWNTTKQMVDAVNGTFLNLANSFGYTEVDTIFVANRTSIWDTLTSLLASVLSLDTSNTTQSTAITGLGTDNTTQSGLINLRALPGTATCTNGNVAQNVTTTTTGTTSQCVALPTLITDTNDTVRVTALEVSNTSQGADITSLLVGNSSKAGIGNCADGEYVMNTTTAGVKCVALPSGIVDTDTWNTTTQMFNAANNSALSLTNAYGLNYSRIVNGPVACGPNTFMTYMDFASGTQTCTSVQETLVSLKVNGNITVTESIFGNINASYVQNAPWLLTAPYSSTYNASNITNAPWLTSYTDTNDTVRVAALEVSNTSQAASIVSLDLSNTTQSTAISLLRTDNTTQGAQIAALLASITSLDISNTTQSTAIGSLRTDNTTLGGLIAALRVDNTTQAALIAALTAPSLDGYFNSITNFTGTLTDTKWCFYDSVISRINCTVTSFVDTNAKVTALEASNVTQEARLLSLDTSNTTQSTALTSLRTDNTTQSAQIAALLASITSLDLSNTTQATALTTNLASITSLDLSNTTQATALTTNLASIVSLDLSNTTQSAAIASLVTDNTTQGALIVNLRTDNTTQAAQIAALVAPSLDGYFNSILNFTGTLTDAKWCAYDSVTEEINCTITAVTDSSAKVTALEASNVSQEARLLSLDTSNTTQSTAITGLGTDNSTQGAEIAALLVSITSLDLSNTTQADYGVHIISLDVSNTTQSTALASLRTDNTTQGAEIAALLVSITSLDLSNTTQADYGVHIISLDISNTTQATALTTNLASIVSLDLSNTTQATALTTNLASITSLDLSNTTQSTALASLRTDNTTQSAQIAALLASITSLDLSNTTQATALTTNLASITSLDLSNTTQAALINLRQGIITTYPAANITAGTFSGLGYTFTNAISAELQNWTTPLSDTSQVLYLPMNKDAKDYSGNGNDGTVSGATLTTSGKYGGAYSFDGNDYISSSLAFNFTTTDFTISFWQNTPVIGNGLYTIDLAKDAADYDGLSIETYGNAYRITLDNGTGYGRITMTSNSENNGWHLVTVTRNRANLSAYVDGVLEQQVNNTPVAGFTSLNTLQIGRWSSTSYFNGTIDEVRIWNRSLASGEIKSLYSQSSEFYGSGFRTMAETDNTTQSAQIATLLASITSLDLSNTTQAAKIASLDASNTTQADYGVHIISIDISNTTLTNAINLKQGVVSTYPAANITTGTFGAGDYTFPANLTMTANILIPTGQKISFNNSAANIYQTSNATGCIIIKGLTSILNVC